ncbi:Crp/Fnr family transcriptional regulator [uncultured Algibacter sp.]|uniref:Crp/Fnr family transcriptional regulator n=1 Tax=uncultured Algibacter sp. TaxID=298659 RepID=UPI00321753D6
MIEKKVLEKYDAEIIQFKKNDYIFKKGDSAKYYFQIIEGGVKMNYYNDKGNEFVQGIFGKNKSFGEPPLLINSNYPANAISINNLTLYRLTKDNFTKLLLNHNNIHFNFTKLISHRLYFKAMMANGITSNSTEEAILTLFKYLKNDIHENDIPFGLKIEFTRKDIAGLLGLSTEATIRTIKKLERLKKVKIINKKVYY